MMAAQASSGLRAAALILFVRLLGLDLSYVALYLYWKERILGNMELSLQLKGFWASLIGSGLGA